MTIRKVKAMRKFSVILIAMMALMAILPISVSAEEEQETPTIYTPKTASSTGIHVWQLDVAGFALTMNYQPEPTELFVSFTKRWSLNRNVLGEYLGKTLIEYDSAATEAFLFENYVLIPTEDEEPVFIEEETLFFDEDCRVVRTETGFEFHPAIETEQGCENITFGRPAD